MTKVRAIAVVLRNPQDPSLLLAVQRPDDDQDLPGVWGLPATTLRPGETYIAAAARLGEAKLGSPLALGPLLAEGSRQREAYELSMKLYDATLSAPEPVLPAKAVQPGVTCYRAWRWAPKSSLEDGAAQGSLCCALALQEHGNGAG